ncbi:MAG: hypothetical protein LW878_11055 [Proteobacteria bacterium]|nr:hypothetical protein [Pseudomonadota bacterium]
MPRSSHAFFLRLLFAKMIFAILLTFPFETHAQRGRDRDRDRDHNGGIDVSFGRGEIYRQTLNLPMRYFDTLDIERELNLPRRAQILRLSVRARSTDYRSAALQLLESGRSSGYSQTISRFSSVVDFIPTGIQSRLELQAQGDLVIEELIAEVQRDVIPGPGPGPGPGGRDIDLFVNQRIFGSQVLPLLQLARQQGHNPQDLLIRGVSVDGESLGRFSQATVQLIINGQRVGFPQQLSLRGRQVILDLPGRGGEVGEDIRNLRLEVMGDAQINTVTLLVARRQGPGPGPGPIPAPMLRLSPQRELNGRLSQTLEQAINVPVGYSNRLVSRIVISASTRATGEFSIIDIARGPLQRVTLDRSTRTTFIQLPQPVALRDIGFNMIGNARIETVDIEFLR